MGSLHNNTFLLQHSTGFNTQCRRGTNERLFGFENLWFSNFKLKQYAVQN